VITAFPPGMRIETVSPGLIPAWSALLARAGADDPAIPRADPDLLTGRLPGRVRGGSVAVLDGEDLLGYCLVRPVPVATAVFAVEFECVVAPGAGGAAVAGPLVGWGLRAAGLIHQEQGGDQRLLVQADVGPTQLAYRRALLAAGFTPDHEYRELSRDLSEPVAPGPLVAGFTFPAFGSFDPADMLRLHNEVSAGAPVKTPGSWAAHLAGGSFRPGLSVVMADRASGRPAALLLAHDFGLDGQRREVWIESLGVRRAERGRALGATLLAHTLDRYRRLGFHGAACGLRTGSEAAIPEFFGRAGFATRYSWVRYLCVR
jgi:mycothiol synthase